MMGLNQGLNQAQTVKAAVRTQGNLSNFYFECWKPYETLFLVTYKFHFYEELSSIWHLCHSTFHCFCCFVEPNKVMVNGITTLSYSELRYDNQSLYSNIIKPKLCKETEIKQTTHSSLSTSNYHFKMEFSICTACAAHLQTIPFCHLHPKWTINSPFAFFACVHCVSFCFW